jgi:hypothetical protein
MEKIITFIGAFLKHVVGILILCWRRMLRAGMIAFGIGVVLALLVAVVSTGQAFPGVLALVAALLFGAALAYGVAMTVFIEEFFLGVVDLLRLLEGDAEAVAHITSTMAEREVGDIGHGLRRLFGLPAPTRPTPLAPTLPALPALPRSPATPPRASAPSAEPIERDAAIAGGAGLAGAALTARAAEPATTPVPIEPPASAPNAEPLDVQAHPIGQPVRADQLPRIGWTLEHEAVRPHHSPLPDTLIELAGSAALTGASHLFGRHNATSSAEPVASEPLDVAVVPPPTLAAPPSAPLEDERLAEPAALTLPEEEEEPAQHVEAAMLTPAPATTPIAATEQQLRLDPAMLTPAPATAPLMPDAPPLDPAMLTPAAPTTPLAPEPEPPAPQAAEPRLDPAMATPAPATTPLLREEEPQPHLPPLDPAMLTPAPATTPIASAPEPERAPAPEPVAAEPSSMEQPAPALSPLPQAVEPALAPAPVAAQPEPTPIEPPPARSAFARVTRPVAELGAALDAFNRVTGNTTPRASAPESGMWERLSQALIDRTGAPSSPFAAPQSLPSSATDDEDESQQG